MPQVIQVEKKPDELEGMLRGVVGSYAGSTFGGMGKKQEPTDVPKQTQVTDTASTPAARRMEQINNDPGTQLRQGKMELASMDPETRKTLEPVLDEGLRRYQQNKQQYGGGYGSV